VKTIAQADLDAAEMTALRTEILRTSGADAQLVFNSADPGALRTDEAFLDLFNAIPTNPALAALRNARLTAMQDAKRQLVNTCP
jgi:hypothetical protein